MCLHGWLICYVCYVLNKDYRCCAKSVQFRVNLVAGYVTILVINNENHANMSNYFALAFFVSN